MTSDDGPERIAAAAVSSNFFALFGVQKAVGRDFLPENEQPGRNQVVILSHGFWQRHFGGSRDVVGRSLLLNDTSFTIAGVLPSHVRFGGRPDDFGGHTHFEVWVPLLNMQRLQRGTHPWRAFGRLRNGVTATAAQAELDVVAHALETEYPSTNRCRRVLIVPLAEQITAGLRTRAEGAATAMSRPR